MDWRYSKIVKIVTLSPDDLFCIYKKGVTSNIGVREKSCTFGKEGAYINTGIPGTGYYERGEKNIPVNPTPKPQAPPNGYSSIPIVYSRSSCKLYHFCIHKRRIMVFLTFCLWWIFSLANIS